MQYRKTGICIDMKIVEEGSSVHLLMKTSEVQKGSIQLKHIVTDKNVADIFTKPVSKVKLEKFRTFILG